MAVLFNKRAKADLQKAMSPLADVVGGHLDLEEAVVKGRFEGHIAEGRMATSMIGGGRLFHTLIIDGAGGSKWLYYAVRPKASDGQIALTFEADDPSLESMLADSVKPLIERELSGAPWARIEYDPVPGHVRLTRPMRTRHDLPDADTYRRQLESVVSVADLNRAVQHSGS
jgi:hypothetical protein